MNMQKKIDRLAQNDAYDVKTVTKALIPDVEWKVEKIPGYADALNKAYDEIDISMEEKFLKEARERLIKKGFTGEKAVRSHGKLKFIIVAGVVIIVANELGYLDPAKRVLSRKLRELDAKLEEVQQDQALQQKVQEVKRTISIEVPDETPLEVSDEPRNTNQD